MCPAGRTLEADLDAVRIFKEFVESQLPKTGKIITPPHVGKERVPHVPSSPFASPGLCSDISSVNGDHMFFSHSSLKFILPLVPLGSTEACELTQDS